MRIPEQAVQQVFAMVRDSHQLAARQTEGQLTAVEQQTLTLFASEKTYAQIAKTRGKSTVTVRNTLYRVQDKLGIHTKQELVIWAVRNGLLDDVVVGNDPQPTRET